MCGCIFDGLGFIRVCSGGWKEWILFGGVSKFEVVMIVWWLGVCVCYFVKKLKWKDY